MSDIKEPLNDTQLSPEPSAAAAPGKPQKHVPGQSWKEGEEHVLPHNRLGIVFFGLMSCTFLAALDQVRRSASPLSHRMADPRVSIDNRGYCLAHYRRQTGWWQRL